MQTGAILDLEPGVVALRVRAMQTAAALPAYNSNPQVVAE